MELLIVILKILLILGTVLLMAAPVFIEYLSFKKDKKNAISYKRFRIVVFSLIYLIAVTLVLYIFKEIVLWFGNLSFVQWIADRVSVNKRFSYCVEVFAVILVNAGIGFLFRFLLSFVRIGLKKKSLLKPKKKDGSFSLGQKIERRVIRFFHTETWFLVARILKWFNPILSAAYALVFIGYQMPAVFGAGWIPYGFIKTLFEAGYLFPMISLIVLWEIYFFLEGIRRVDDECPELLREDADELKEVTVDLAKIDEECRKCFKDYYVCSVEESIKDLEDTVKADHGQFAGYIGDAAQNDDRNPKTKKDIYLSCIDKISQSDNSVLINGNFFTEFSHYFFRYLSVIIARGDNVVLVCNDDSQIDTVYDYLKAGFSELSSLYCKGFNADSVNFDDPIWRITKISGDKGSVYNAAIDDNSVLITTLNYLCSAEFEREHSQFIHLLDTVVFVDTLATINAYSRQMSILNTRLSHITKNNAALAKNSTKNRNFKVRYMSRQVRYICFDDSRTPGLDRVLKNMLSVDFESVDAMRYNSQSLIRCYSFEGKNAGDGKSSVPHFIQSEEEIGAVMNMAILCLAKGASNVTIFAEGAIPYANIAETVQANMGQLAIAVDASKLRVNEHFYNPDNYSVIIAVDSNNNLPVALRKYSSMATDKPCMVIIFSRPYMLRDYYADNIEGMWRSSQLTRIPVEDGTKRDILQKIIIKANAGGISEKEILNLAASVPQLSKYVEEENINGILREILQTYNISLNEYTDLYSYFEFSSSKDFDEQGNFNPQDKVHLRRRGKLFDMVNGRDMIVMVTGEGEVVLPIPRGRMTQNFIVGQNLLYNGNIYYIQKIDVEKGRVYTRLTVGGKNDEPFQYIQERHYTMDCSKAETQQFKHVVMKRSQDDVKLTDAYIKVFRAPAEVVTKGYYTVDQYCSDLSAENTEYVSISDPENDKLSKQTYRKFGDFSEPTYSSDSIMKEAQPIISANGMLCMSIRLSGQFGENSDKIASLAAVMLNELLHSMFVSTADAVVVCPVLKNAEMSEEAKEVLKKYPHIKFIGKEEAESSGDIELVIVEDSDVDLGVVSVLMSAGDDVLSTLFSPVLSYLDWYFAVKEKNEEGRRHYLHFGLGHEPDCFDFKALRSLSAMLGDANHKLDFVDVESVVEYDNCDFCGKRYVKGDGAVELEDGRRMCKECQENLVGNNKKVLRGYLERAKIFLESTYGITLDDDYEFCFESTVKIANTLKQNRKLKKRSADIPLKSYVDDKNKVHVEYSIPSASLSELIIRELTYVWQTKHLPQLTEELAEGHIALVAIQYLRFLNQSTLAGVRTNYYETTDNVSGVGYRKLVRELLDKPQYNNNPFRYLLEASGESVEDKIVTPVPRVIADGVYGKSYTPEAHDRCAAGEMPYFYYSRLTASRQAMYDAACAAIEAHQDKLTVAGSFEDMQVVSDAIRYDRPQYFYYKNFSMRGNEVFLFYGATAEEVDLLNRQMEEIIPKYLEGIDDSMSAYDAAIRIHVKLINSVDYDTIALNKEEEAGGPAKDKIDYLRTICGVFLNGKAVCEGYARALQFLLHRCGIECAEAVGYIKKEGKEKGGAHAWNIVKIDGEYYYVDTTWDDSSNTIQTVKKTDLGFDYFCITTEELCRTRDLSICPCDMPACSAVKANYYYHNDMVIESYDLAKIKTVAQAAAQAGEKSFTFKCKTKRVYDDALNNMCAVGQDCYDVLKVAAKADKKIDSHKYSYSFDRNIYTITVHFKYK